MGDSRFPLSYMLVLSLDLRYFCRVLRRTNYIVSMKRLITIDPRRSLGNRGSSERVSSSRITGNRTNEIGVAALLGRIFQIRLLQI